jgi:hypothetical protein
MASLDCRRALAAHAEAWGPKRMLMQGRWVSIVEAYRAGHWWASSRLPRLAVALVTPITPGVSTENREASTRHRTCIMQHDAGVGDRGKQRLQQRVASRLRPRACLVVYLPFGCDASRGEEGWRVNPNCKEAQTSPLSAVSVMYTPCLSAMHHASFAVCA